MGHTKKGMITRKQQPARITRSKVASATHLDNKCAITWSGFILIGSTGPIYVSDHPLYFCAIHIRSSELNIKNYDGEDGYILRLLGKAETEMRRAGERCSTAITETNLLFT